jgi:heme-degrading monooxygenase HmoA
MSEIANTPEPPYYAVIFTSLRGALDEEYEHTGLRMLELAEQQSGYLGIESVEESSLGITVSYWRSLEDIAAWKRQLEHREAQRLGRERWYQGYTIRIARVERNYGFMRDR